MRVGAGLETWLAPLPGGEPHPCRRSSSRCGPGAPPWSFSRPSPTVPCVSAGQRARRFGPGQLLLSRLRAGGACFAASGQEIGVCRGEGAIGRGAATRSRRWSTRWPPSARARRPARPRLSGGAGRLPRLRPAGPRWSGCRGERPPTCADPRYGRRCFTTPSWPMITRRGRPISARPAIRSGSRTPAGAGPGSGSIGCATSSGRSSCPQPARPRDCWA